MIRASKAEDIFMGAGKLFDEGLEEVHAPCVAAAAKGGAMPERTNVERQACMRA